MTSGGLKNKDPQYREITVQGLSITSLQMIPIPPLNDQEITADFSPGCFMIYLRAHNEQYVCAEEGGNKELMANRKLAREWETFEIVKLEGNHVALKAFNGKFVHAIGGGGGKLKADRNWIKSHETFTLVRRGRNEIALKAHNGKFVCAEGGGGRELLANRGRALEWETFNINGELAGFWPPPVIPTLLTPRDGTIYRREKPTVTLSWSSVFGALSYGIEIQQNINGRWVAYKTVQSIKTTRYSLTLHGRMLSTQWRVWSLADGHQSPKSHWFHFNFSLTGGWQQPL